MTTDSKTDGVTATGSPSLLNILLTQCVQSDASDLHLAPNLPPYLRTHGILEPIPGYEPILSAVMECVAEELRGEIDPTPLTRTGSLDGAFTAVDGTRFRFNIFRRQGKLSIALRRLEDRFRSLIDLGLPDSLYNLCALPDGLVIVAGPTGAGKSTTLATLIDRINQTRKAHIVTIEDPIEYIHNSAKSLVNQRQVGSDAASFNDALVASLRQDPDVILVGEIRDLDTIRTAITAAETGHLVFTTVHAGDCVGTVERLVSVFPADEQHGIRRQLALVLRAIITQHLLVANGERETAQGEAAQAVRRRRVVASEIMMITSAVSNLIATGKSTQIYSSMESGGAVGMQTLEENLARLWSVGYLTEEAALAAARNPAIVRDRYARLQQRPGPMRTNGESNERRSRS
jgi:twitching motility protein PilT